MTDSDSEVDEQSKVVVSREDARGLVGNQLSHFQHLQNLATNIISITVAALALIIAVFSSNAISITLPHLPSDDTVTSAVEGLPASEAVVSTTLVFDFIGAFFLTLGGILIITDGYLGLFSTLSIPDFLPVFSRLRDVEVELDSNPVNRDSKTSLGPEEWLVHNKRILNKTAAPLHHGLQKVAIGVLALLYSVTVLYAASTVDVKGLMFMNLIFPIVLSMFILAGVISLLIALITGNYEQFYKTNRTRIVQTAKSTRLLILEGNVVSILTVVALFPLFIMLGIQALIAYIWITQVGLIETLTVAF